MGIIFMDGFEKNSLDQWTTTTGASVAAAAGYDMSGSYLAVTTNDNYLKKTLSTSYSSLYVSFRLRHSRGSVGASYNNQIFVFFDSAGTQILTISLNGATRYLELRRGSQTGTLLATGSTAISTSDTHHFKVSYTPLNSGGTITVVMDNGFETLTYTGDTTNGLENVQSIGLGGWAGGGRYDDCVISTSAISQILKIGGKAVSGAGTTTEWDPSTGSNYECIDEIPPSSTDYNSTNTTNEIDTFALADATESIDTIAAVQVEFNAAYEGGPTPTHVQACIRSGGTNYFSSDFSPPASFGAPHVAIWAVDPATSAAFTESGFNALEVGYKATA